MVCCVLLFVGTGTSWPLTFSDTLWLLPVAVADTFVVFAEGARGVSGVLAVGEVLSLPVEDCWRVNDLAGAVCLVLVPAALLFAAITPAKANAPASPKPTRRIVKIRPMCCIKPAKGAVL